MTTVRVVPKILFLVTDASTAHSFVRPIANFLVDNGFDVHIAYGGQDDAPDGLGRQSHYLPFRRTANVVATARAALQTCRLVKSLRVDIVLCATPMASFLGVLAGRIFGVPLVVHLAWGLRSESMTGPSRWLVRLAENITVSAANLTVANSPSLHRAIVSNRRHSNARVIYLGSGSSHGVDIDRFSFALPRIPSDEVRVGFVGRLRTDKGILELLEATKRIIERGTNLTLILTGPLEEEEILTAAREHPSVVVNPPTPDVPALMTQLDILCLPSWREGFPNVVLEASATGRPVIVSDATGARDSVLHGQTGLMVPVKDVDALDKAISYLANHPAERLRMGQNGREWVESNFVQKDVLTLLTQRISNEYAKRRHT